MSYLPKPTEGGDFTPPPAGTHMAICYRVIDLGTQETTYLGDERLAHQVMIGWELKGDDTIMEDGRPFTIHNRYTWSMSEKANLRKHLESWRGVKFADKDFGPAGWNINSILGKACLISIVHKERNEKTYANIASIMNLPKGMSAGSLINESVYLWLSPEGFEPGIFESLSDGLKSTIKKSPEYLALVSGKMTPSRNASHFEDSEIPF